MRQGNSSLNCLEETYALMLSHIMYLLMVYVRKASWLTSSPLKCLRKTYPRYEGEGLCKEGKLDEAMKLFFEMARRNICPNVVTYNALIDGLCKEGKLAKVGKLFSEMVAKNICPNLFTYNALINGLCKERKWQEATRVLHEMLNKGASQMLSHTTLLLMVLAKKTSLRKLSSYSMLW